MLSGATHPGLSHEAVGRWIERNGTNAESLLAAAQTEGGQEHLLKALELYPHDPRVLCASIRLNDSPEAKRERLERFKAADPENALPYYLSAREHLKRSEPEKAIGDLLAASQQGRFDDYTLQAMQSAEELYLSAGVSPGEAKAVGGASVLLPHLAQLKDLTVGLMDLRQQYVAAGDGQSADNLTRFSLQLAEHLTSGEGSRFVINQLVGAAIQQIALNKLDANQSYDFLPGGVGPSKDQIAVFRDSIKQDNKIVEQWLTTANEQQVMSYFDRIKLYGERSAFEWVKNAR